MLTAAALPPLSAEEARHSDRVADRLRALIEGAGGWLPFSRFMECALYEPGLGYYTAGRQPFGAGADFITAPELSPLFARCLAAQVEELLDRIGGGDVVEYGAGSGRLAADLLDALAARGALPRRYRIVEPSEALRAEQRERLSARSAHADRADWLPGPPDSAWQGVAIANEVVDALPVDRFRVTPDGCEAIGVVAAGAGFAFRAGPADDALAGAVRALSQRLPQPLPAGYQSELCLRAPGWLASAVATQSRGALLAFDYGLPRAQYYHPSRAGATLAGFHRHRRLDDVLLRPGLVDLSAWVDFSALADAGQDAGFEVQGFATQAHFLAATGIERELAALLGQAAERERIALAAGALTLMLPGEMGERFKLLALARGVAGPLAGFSFRDLATSL
ncbi:MAG: class I SAM-dependent methyltransferase [Gammaproteobacteria bacterium]